MVRGAKAAVGTTTRRDRLARWAANNRVLLAATTVGTLLTVAAGATDAAAKLWYTVVRLMAPRDSLELAVTEASYRRLEFSVVNTTREPLDLSSLTVYYMGNLDGCPTCLRMNPRLDLEVVLNSGAVGLHSAGKIQFMEQQRVLGSSASISIAAGEAIPMAFAFSGEEMDGAVLIAEVVLVNPASAKVTKSILPEMIVVPSRVTRPRVVQVVPLDAWRAMPDAWTRKELAKALTRIDAFCCAQVAKAARDYKDNPWPPSD